MFANISELTLNEFHTNSVDLTVNNRVAPMQTSYANGKVHVDLADTESLSKTSFDIYSSGTTTAERVNIIYTADGVLPASARTAAAVGFSNTMTTDANNTLASLAGPYELHGLLYRAVAAMFALTCGGCTMNSVAVPAYPTEINNLKPNEYTEVYILPNRNLSGQLLTQLDIRILNALMEENTNLVSLNNIQLPDYVQGLHKGKIFVIRQVADNTIANITPLQIWNIICWLSDYMSDFSEAMDSICYLIATRCCFLHAYASHGLVAAKYHPDTEKALNSIFKYVRMGGLERDRNARAQIIKDIVATSGEFAGVQIVEANRDRMVDRALNAQIGGVPLGVIDGPGFCSNFCTYAQRMSVLNIIRVALGAGEAKKYDNDGCVTHQWKRSAIGVSSCVGIQSSGGASLLFAERKPDASGPNRLVTMKRFLETQRSVCDHIARTAISIRLVVDYIFQRSAVSHVTFEGDHDREVAAQSMVADFISLPSVKNVISFDGTEWYAGIAEVSRYMFPGAYPLTKSITLNYVIPEVSDTTRELPSARMVDTVFLEDVRYKLFPESIFAKHAYVNNARGVSRVQHYLDYYEYEKKELVAGAAINTWEVPGFMPKINLYYQYDGHTYYESSVSELYKVSVTTVGGSRVMNLCSLYSVSDADVWSYGFETAPCLVLTENTCTYQHSLDYTPTLAKLGTLYIPSRCYSYHILNPLLRNFNIKQNLPAVKTCSVDVFTKCIVKTDGGSKISLSGFLKKEEKPAGDEKEH